MKGRPISQQSTRWSLALAPLLLVSCIEYSVETAVSADGGGRRTEEMVVREESDEDFTVTPDQFRALMHVSEADGWRHARETRDGKEVHVFRRETAIAGLGDWTKLDGRIRISGTVPRGRSAPYADVEFSNRLNVGSGQDSGARTMTFSETFYFAGLADALIDHEVRRFSEGLSRELPGLDETTRGELVGLARGGIAVAVELDMMEKEETEEFSGLITRLAGQAARLLADRGDGDGSSPPAEEALFEELLRWTMLEGDDDDLAFVESELPGARLAGNTSLSLRLELPGEVLETNADKTDDGALIWELSPWDAMTAPVEIHAMVRVR